MEYTFTKNGRRHQKKWKTTSKKMEDDLKKNENGRQPQFCMKIEDNLNFLTLEDDLNFLNMEDDLIFI